MGLVSFAPSKGQLVFNMIGIRSLAEEAYTWNRNLSVLLEGVALLSCSEVQLGACSV